MKPNYTGSHGVFVLVIFLSDEELAGGVAPGHDLTYFCHSCYDQTRDIVPEVVCPNSASFAADSLCQIPGLVTVSVLALALNAVKPGSVLHRKHG